MLGVPPQSLLPLNHSKNYLFDTLLKFSQTADMLAANFALIALTIITIKCTQSYIPTAITRSSRISSKAFTRSALRMAVDSIVSPFDSTSTASLDDLVCKFRVNRTRSIYYFITTFVTWRTLHVSIKDDDDELELTRENVELVLDEMRPYLMADGYVVMTEHKLSSI